MGVYPIVLSQNRFTHQDKLTYPFEERGLQFGDGIYEVIRIYDGSYYLFTEHVNRLFRSAEAIKLQLPFSKEELKDLLQDLLSQNNMEKDGIVYLQATRGSAPRNHIFPNDDVPANAYAYVKDLPRNLTNLDNGVSAIIKEDIRWKHCYIKSLNLLPNVLAKQEAKENNCYEAILHEEGTVTECSSSNVYLVKNGRIYTHPATKRILHGCVRMAVERFAESLQIPFEEEAFKLADILDADEMFLSSSTSEVLPIVTVDGSPIADGKPGAFTKKLQEAYREDAQINKRQVTI